MRSAVCADGTKVCLKGGFDPSCLYELVCVAKDPKVMGVGLAALRDTVTFFRKGTADAAGTANPLAGRIQYAIGQGTSQSGNAMKTFLHLGFNEALDGSKVFEGLIPFHRTEATRIAAGDTRPSVQSLYGTQAGYVAAVTAAANDLVAQRFLLRRDADRLIGEAQATVVLP